jgi:hypothetical protein
MWLADYPVGSAYSAPSRTAQGGIRQTGAELLAGDVKSRERPRGMSPEATMGHAWTLEG